MERIEDDTMIENNEGVHVRPASTCMLCGSEGTLLYQDLRDRLFDAPGSWSLMRCPGCGLVWLNPQPVPEDIGELYRTYFTHDTSNDGPRLAAVLRFVANSILATRLGYTELTESAFQTVLGRVLSWMGPIKEIVELGAGCLDGRARGRLLDVGCGLGAFLAKMKELGWEVVGVEPDGQAVKVARNHFGFER